MTSNLGFMLGPCTALLPGQENKCQVRAGDIYVIYTTGYWMNYCLPISVVLIISFPNYNFGNLTQSSSNSYYSQIYAWWR